MRCFWPPESCEKGGRVIRVDGSPRASNRGRRLTIVPFPLNLGLKAIKKETGKTRVEVRRGRRGISEVEAPEEDGGPETRD